LTPTGVYDFRAISNPVAGASTVQTIGGVFNFGTAGSALIPASVSTALISHGTNVQASVTPDNYSARGNYVNTGLTTNAVLDGVTSTNGAADNATFTVDNNLVTLSGDYSSTGLAGMLTDINSNANLGLTDITATSDAAGKIIFTRNDSGTGSTVDQAAVVVAVTGDAKGANATALGFADPLKGTSNAGAAVAFTVDGTNNVLLKGDYSLSGMTGLLAALNPQLTGITATSANGSDITFTRNTLGATKAIAVAAGTNAASANIVSTDGTGTLNTDAFDFSGALAAKAQFDISGGIDTVTGLAATKQITLNTDVADLATLVSTINGQLSGQHSNILASGANGVLTFTNVGQTAAVTFSGLDAGATALNLGSVDPLVTTTVTGAPAQATTNATLTVDNANLTLTAGTNRASLITELNKQIQAAAAGTTLGDDKANYLAVASGVSGIQIQHTGSTAAVVIKNVDSKAAAAGFTNSTGVAGDVAQVASNKATFTIDSTKSIVLDANYGGINGLQGAILDQLTNKGGGYTVTNDGTVITIARTDTGADSAAVSITAGKTGVDADGNGGAAGLTALGDADGIVTGSPGTDAGAVTNTSFKVDGTVVKLTTDYTGVTAKADMMQAIEDQLTGYTVSSTGGNNITITNDANGSAAVTLTANAAATAAEKANAIAFGFGAAVGTAGTEGGAVTVGLGTLVITAGSNGRTVDMGSALGRTYASSQKLADAINADVSGVYASIGAAKNADGSNNADAGKLILSSANSFQLNGGALGLTADTYEATTGSLATADVKTVAGANNAISAVDAALSTVSTLRSTFGAVQNRFDSVIASLSSTSENLSAARSRIVDTDFAAETANLTRNQILQQAGTAMLAQANSLPQSVLSLLK